MYHLLPWCRLVQNAPNKRLPHPQHPHLLTTLLATLQGSVRLRRLTLNGASEQHSRLVSELEYPSVHVEQYVACALLLSKHLRFLTKHTECSQNVNPTQW